jgi:hypothetical protein
VVVRSLVEVTQFTTGWIEIRNQGSKPIRGLIVVIKYETTSPGARLWMTYRFGSDRSNINKLNSEFLPDATTSLISTTPFVLTSCPATAKIEAVIVDFADGTRSSRGSEGANQLIFPANLSLSSIGKAELPAKNSIYALRFNLDAHGAVTSISPYDFSSVPPSRLVQAMQQWRFLLPPGVNSRDLNQISVIVRIDKDRCTLPDCPFPLDSAKLPSPLLLIDIPTFEQSRGDGSLEVYLGGIPLSARGEPRFVAPL